MHKDSNFSTSSPTLVIFWFWQEDNSHSFFFFFYFWESPALNPPSSALRAARPADLAEPGKDGPDWRSHEAAAKLTRSGPAPRALDQSSKNAFPQLYYV